jgi:glycosyltransferase involved in cell wall biosynthesis
MDLSRAARVERAIGHIDPHIEQFSHPFSRYRIEQHPWVREADVINLHWVSCFLDYARFFATVEKPIVWTLHDQNPYLGGFHYEWERDRFPEMTGAGG